MYFISPLQASYKKTPSLSLRLRVAGLRRSSVLFRICSIFVACLFPGCSVIVSQRIEAANYY
jgi:hypothetical protein